MKIFWLGGFAAVLVLGSAATGQDAALTPVATLQAPRPTSSSFSEMPLSPPVVTPELWLYSQEWRRHDDPAQAVRRKAELRTEQRMQRQAAMKWYGFSNSRPQAAVTPFMGTYSPAWVGNGPERYDWAGGGYPNRTVFVENYLIQR